MRILIIARHFPPAISGGARRPYLWAKNLLALGADVFVVAPDKMNNVPGIAEPHPNRDPAHNRASPRRTLRDVARTWLRWPDPDIAWARRAATAAETALPWAPDWVLTTSPPESLHFAGRRLARKLGARWAADFRDPWLLNGLSPDRRGARAAIEHVLARAIVPKADLVIAVNTWIANELVLLGARKPPLIIGHFAERSVPPSALDPRFINIAYTGSFTLSHPKQDIHAVLAPFEAAFGHNPRLRLHMMGRLTAAEVAAIEASPARGAILVYGPRPYPEALALQSGADALLITAPPDFEGVPGKLAEYRAAGPPIIACGEGAWIALAGLNPPGAASAMLAATVRQSPAPDTLGADSSARTETLRLLEAMRQEPERG